MQQCPACHHNLPDREDLVYCPKCVAQLWCKIKSCKAPLELDAVGCVVCGALVGKNEITSDVKVLTAKETGNQSTAINTLNFLEINKGITRSLDAAFTDEFGISIGGAALAAIINGGSPIEKLKNGRVQVQDVYPTEVQQLSLFGTDCQQTVDVEADKQAMMSKNTDKNSGSSKKSQNSSSRPKRPLELPAH